MLLYPTKGGPIHETKNRCAGAVLDKILLADSDREYIDEDGILLGWKALLAIMTASSQDLTVMWQEKLGHMIGGGAYANVFPVDAKSVRKVSGRCRNGHMKIEVNYLKKLGSAVNYYPETVSRYENSGNLDIIIGNLAPYIQTTPHGMPLYYCLLKQQSKQKFLQLVGNIGTGMQQALDFVHQHNFCHNDVSNQNIVVKNGRPVLIDFGNGADIGSKHNKFFGT